MLTNFQDAVCLSEVYGWIKKECRFKADKKSIISINDESPDSSINDNW